MKKLCYGISIVLCVGAVFAFCSMMSAVSEIKDTYSITASEKAIIEAQAQVQTTTAGITAIGILLCGAFFAVMGKIIEHNEFMEKAVMVAYPAVAEELEKADEDEEKTAVEKEDLISEEKLTAETMSYKTKE